MPNEKHELTERKKQILKAIIETHIMAGEPVGSKYLTQYKQIAFSSATIRNEMAELEEMGYLEQPHTSAGRIPSEQGYRFYVDELMQEYNITSAEIGELNKLVKGREMKLNRILDRASKLMSALTNYTGVALTRSQSQTVITRFDTMFLSENCFILVMLTTGGVVKTKQIHLGFDITRETLEKLSSVLNEYVAGQELEGVTLPVILEMQERLEPFGMLVNPIIKTIYDTVNEPENSELVFDGVNNLLNYPEYADIDKVRDVLGIFDKKEDLLEVMEGAENDKTNVYIGSENSVEVMNHSSLIFRNVKAGDRVVGAIGVIGPRRMDYSKVVTLVDYMSRTISRMIENEDLIDRPPDETHPKE